MNIEDFFKIYQESAWRKDAKSMIDLYHEEAVIFDMWDKGYELNSTKWNLLIHDWFESLGDEKVQVDFEMISISQSAEIGIASALIKFQALSKDGNLLRSMKNRITLAFTKVGNKWKVTHQHTSAPISSKDLSAILDI